METCCEECIGHQQALSPWTDGMGWKVGVRIRVKIRIRIDTPRPRYETPRCEMVSVRSV